MYVRVIVVALGLSTIATVAGGQEHDIRARLWGAIGAGPGFPTSGGDGIANMAQLVYQKRSHHAAVRALILHDIDRATNEIGEIGALYGRTSVMGSFPVVVAAGLSGVAFSTCPDDDDSCFTIGVPIVAEASRSTTLIGIGIQAFTNVNAKAPYAGGLFFLKLGRLR